MRTFQSQKRQKGKDIRLQGNFLGSNKKMYNPLLTKDYNKHTRPPPPPPPSHPVKVKHEMKQHYAGDKYSRVLDILGIK